MKYNLSTAGSKHKRILWPNRWSNAQISSTTSRVLSTNHTTTAFEICANIIYGCTFERFWCSKPSDTQRAQPTLRLHSFLFCSWKLWCFCRKPNIIGTFWKHLNCSREEWKLLILSGSLLGISSRLESSLPFAKKNSLVFCEPWTAFEVSNVNFHLSVF